VGDSFKLCPICRKPVAKEQLLRVQPKPQSPSKPATKGAFRSSSKIDALLAELNQIRAANASDKCIVFSQWTSMLDLIEVWDVALCCAVVEAFNPAVQTALEGAGIVFVRLDGSLSQVKRADVLLRFKDDASVMVRLGLTVCINKQADDGMVFRCFS
jgi:SNF2 family DNA or RNA helicase